MTMDDRTHPDQPLDPVDLVASALVDGVEPPDGPAPDDPRVVAAVAELRAVSDLVGRVDAVPVDRSAIDRAIDQALGAADDRDPAPVVALGERRRRGTGLLAAAAAVVLALGVGAAILAQRTADDPSELSTAADVDRSTTAQSSDAAGDEAGEAGEDAGEQERVAAPPTTVVAPPAAPPEGYAGDAAAPPAPVTQGTLPATGSGPVHLGDVASVGALVEQVRSLASARTPTTPREEATYLAKCAPSTPDGAVAVALARIEQREVAAVVVGEEIVIVALDNCSILEAE